jgi:thiol-disulfide isomerase/thioredoxin
MGKGDKGMGAAMCRLMLIVCLALIVPLFSFAKPSEKLPLPKELQAGELPWFALDMKDGEGTYNGVINNDKLKKAVKQRNSKRVVFVFFATWCVPCREGLKLMSEKADELKKRDALIVLVNFGEDDYGKIDKWVEKYAAENWLLGFDKYANLPENFGLAKQGGEMPLPKTLILDSNLRPLILIGQEGDDFPQILWSK